MSQYENPRDPEEVLLTFQVGLVASDGIILASDTRITEFVGGMRTTSTTQKIIVSDGPRAMYCWSGNPVAGEIATLFLNRLKGARDKTYPAMGGIRDHLLMSANDTFSRAGMIGNKNPTDSQLRFNVSFRQGCEACCAGGESGPDGGSGPYIFRKQGVHVVAYAIPEIVADGAYAIQPGD